MKVFILPTGLHSRAMVRVAKALIKYAPPDVQFVGKPAHADVQVLHVISSDAFLYNRPQEYVVIQYCFKSAGGSLEQWQDFWSRSRFVWSYYDLDVMKVPFYYSPLGVDEVFKTTEGNRNSVMTSGFVSGPGSEPIEDVAIAAASLKMPTIHIGPQHVEGMKHYPNKFKVYSDVGDEELVELYNRSLWVSGMRYVEGFEMPAVEGLACGARPICFDRAEMRKWYNGHAVFVPETSGQELRQILVNVLQSPPVPVTMAEREKIADQFSWPKIAHGFWQHMGV